MNSPMSYPYVAKTNSTTGEQDRIAENEQMRKEHRERQAALTKIMPLINAAARRRAQGLPESQIELLLEAQAQLDMARQRYQSAQRDAELLTDGVLFPHS